MRVWRAVRVLLAATVALSCGRIGYDLLAVPNDTGSGGGSSGAGPAADVGTPGDAGADTSTVPVEAGPDTSTVPVEAGPDGGGLDASLYPSCSSTAISWVFSFNSDPTQYDGNGDGILDWTVRGGGAFPVDELDGGVWYSPMQTPLDTRPLNDFSNRVIVDVRFLSATVAPTNRGAVFWINLNENGPQFSALFASTVAQADGGQALTLFGKPDAAAEVPIVIFPNLESTFIDLHLDVDPTSLDVGLWIDGTFQGTYSFPQTGPPNADHFATLLSWQGLSEFQSVSIVECAN
jgi:hypothetical protein